MADMARPLLLHVAELDRCRKAPPPKSPHTPEAGRASFLISQSEADQFSSCQRKHYYAFGEKLQPITFGAGLTRGLVGHEILAKYYTELKNGTSYAQARQLVIRSAIDNIPEGLPYTEFLALISLLEAYFDFYSDEVNHWQILAVEQEFKFGNFPFTPDLIRRDRSTGKIYVVDHKFLYNFYSDSTIEILPQLVKYLGALRELGYPVYGVEYNMIRHRINARERFKRVLFSPSDLKVTTYMKEQKDIERTITKLKNLPLDEWEAKVKRTASAFNCQHCSFLSLCSSDLNGSAGRKLLKRTAYTANTYGYTEEVES